MHFVSLRGVDIAPHLPEIAQLRITVFREFPYLYDGSLEYEMHYLEAYVRSARSLVVLAREGDQAIGATTALPLADADTEFREAFITQRINPETVYYFGESVLLPAYRGRGYGHRFFDEREAVARQSGFSLASFCAVVRPPDHPLKPAGYIPHDRFWQGRGYSPVPGLCCQYHWKDIDQPQSTAKTMQFWWRSL